MKTGLRSIYLYLPFLLSGGAAAMQGPEENQQSIISSENKHRAMTDDGLGHHYFDSLSDCVAKRYDNYSLGDAQKELKENSKALIQKCKNIVPGSYQKIAMLIKAGADVNATDGEGSWTPLHYAACENSSEILEILIEYGANIKAQALHGVTPLKLAASHGSPKNIQILKEAGADIEDGFLLLSVVSPIFFNRKNAIKLIELGAIVNRKDSIGFTPLLQAARGEDEELVKILLEKSADAFAQIEKFDNQGYTPLHFAAYNCSVSICSLILGKLGLFDESPAQKPNKKYSLSQHIISTLLRDNDDFMAIIENSGHTFESSKELIIQGIVKNSEALADQKNHAKFINSIRKPFIGEYYRKKLFNLAQKLVAVENHEGKTALELVERLPWTKEKDKKRKKKTVSLLTQVQHAHEYYDLPQEIILIAGEGIKKHILGH